MMTMMTMMIPVKLRRSENIYEARQMISMTLSSGLSSFYKSRTHVLDGFYSCYVLCSEEPFRSLCCQ